MVRFLTYDVKQLVRTYESQKVSYKVMHFTAEVSEIKDGLTNDQVVVIIVPILLPEVVEKTREKIQELDSLGKNLKIHLFAVFAEIDLLSELTAWKSNLYIATSFVGLEVAKVLKM